MTEEQKEKYRRTRQIRAAESKERAERRRAVRRVLGTVIISEHTDEKEKLEAAHLLVELNKSYY